MPATAAHTHAAHWSRTLFACLQEMAAHRTNAVLLALAGAGHMESQRRYPESGLVFAERRWKAFYHCHEPDSRQAGEHGHFHIFTGSGAQTWAHVAGLGMDSSGQPLHWFAVNRWVTDGPWLERMQLLQQLQTATAGADDPLAGRWLLAMLQLYLPVLANLLQDRDRRVERHVQGGNYSAVLEDHAIYELGMCSIDLPSMLGRHLL